MILSDKLFEFCNEHESDDIHTLALQSEKYPAIEISQAIQQIKGLQIAKKKLPTYYQNKRIIYPPHLALEQCSSEHTALYKASIVSRGSRMIDLTGGFGIDFSFLAPLFDEAVYVEQQAELVSLALHNFETLGLRHVTVKKDDGVNYLYNSESVDFIYLDPARRNNLGNKTVLIEDCSPNILEIQSELDNKAECVMIKLSPMLDITLALKSMTNITSVHIVSVDNECKELLFIKKRNSSISDIQFQCVNIKDSEIQQFSFNKNDEIEAKSIYTSLIATYLYEPNSSIMKAGAYNIIAERFDLKKLHSNSHLYTSDSFVNDFPGKKFKVVAVFSLNKKELKNYMKNIEQANVAVRNFPMKAEELKSKLKIKDGGNQFVFGTTTSDEKRVLILCERV